MAREPKKIDTRLTITLSPYAFNELTKLSKSIGSAPATLAVRPVEDWVLSPEFVALVARVQSQSSLQDADDEGSDRA